MNADNPATSRWTRTGRRVSRGRTNLGQGYGAWLRVFLVGLCLAGPTASQASTRADLKIAPGPYYVGVPIDLHVQIAGLEATPEPRCSADPVEGGELQFASMTPNISTQVSIINGRTTRIENVTFVCHFSLTVSRPGETRLGPFRAVQGQTQAQSPVYAISVQTIAPDPRVKIRLILPKKPLFVGQRLEIGIEWWIAAELKEIIQNYEIHSRLFEMPNAFRFVDDRQPGRGEQTLEIQTEAGELTLPAEVEQRSSQGTNFLVVRAQRTLVPLHPGEFELGRATLSLNEVTRWQRDFFGGRRPAATRRLFGRDAEQRIIVREAPEKDRPDSFGGAIGRGFSFEVAADRSVVQRGDPISLTFTVRGEGGLTNVGLPNLEGSHALPPKSFKLPADPPPGEIVEGSKIFRVPVRILDESLEEIPALPYSWFDPELGEYQTVYSRPIALSVRPAQLISAADVIAAEAAPGSPADPPKRAEPVQPESGPLSLSGADLAIQLDRNRLLGARDASGFRLGAVYGAPLLVLVAAILYRRRRDRDPEILRLAAVCKEQERRIDAAASMPGKEGLGEIASALRELGGLPGESRDPARDALIAECDAVFYSPATGQASGVDPQLVERARALALEIRSRLGRSRP